MSKSKHESKRESDYLGPASTSSPEAVADWYRSCDRCKRGFFMGDHEDRFEWFNGHNCQNKQSRKD